MEERAKRMTAVANVLVGSVVKLAAQVCFTVASLPILSLVLNQSNLIEIACSDVLFQALMISNESTNCEALTLS